MFDDKSLKKLGCRLFLFNILVVICSIILITLSHNNLISDTVRFYFLMLLNISIIVFNSYIIKGTGEINV